MCGRFAFSFTWAQIHALLGLTSDLGSEPPFMTPRFNAAPTQMLPVAVERDGERTLMPMHWGLVPAWAKDRSMAGRLINARSETVEEKPTFRDAYRQRRCLVPASGFYEWKQPEKRGGPKQPYIFRLRSGEGFAMAGLWEQCGSLNSFTILTTQANSLVADLHDRMPVILRPESYEMWVGANQDTDVGSTRSGLLVPLDPELMTAHPVSTRVGNPANDDAALIDPIELINPERSDGGSDMGLFDGI